VDFTRGIIKPLHAGASSTVVVVSRIDGSFSPGLSLPSGSHQVPRQAKCVGVVSLPRFHRSSHNVVVLFKAWTSMIGPLTTVSCMNVDLLIWIARISCPIDGCLKRCIVEDSCGQKLCEDSGTRASGIFHAPSLFEHLVSSLGVLKPPRILGCWELYLPRGDYSRPSNSYLNLARPVVSVLV
jgi:hypothetical protein